MFIVSFTTICLKHSTRSIDGKESREETGTFAELINEPRQLKNKKIWEGKRNKPIDKKYNLWYTDFGKSESIEVYEFFKILRRLIWKHMN